MMSFFLLATVCSLFSLVFALPAILPIKRDVWAPTITNPTNQSVWVAGSTYNVTWNTSNEPSDISNPTGSIYLRDGADATKESLLTQGFLLIAGAVNVTIPATTAPDTDYIIILVGDSGDWSPEFTIVAPPA